MNFVTGAAVVACLPSLLVRRRESLFFRKREVFVPKNDFLKHPGGEGFGPFVLLTAGNLVIRYRVLLNTLPVVVFISVMHGVSTNKILVKTFNPEAFSERSLKSCLVRFNVCLVYMMLFLANSRRYWGLVMRRPAGARP